MSKRKGSSIVRYFRQTVRHSLLLVAALLFLAAIYLATHLEIANYFPITKVNVVGLSHIDKEEVRQTLLPLVQRGFFAINIDTIRDRLQQMPWTDEIAVRRLWPDSIDIMVSEKIVAARWNHVSLLSTEGQLFIPKDASGIQGIPEFVGPDGQQITMLKYFVNINRILSPLHAKISYLELTPYFTWMLKLDNGMALKIGHNDILTRLNHFVKVYPKIVGERAEEVEYIDLRYPNGMAVKWKNAG